MPKKKERAKPFPAAGGQAKGGKEKGAQAAEAEAEMWEADEGKALRLFAAAVAARRPVEVEELQAVSVCL